MLPGKNRGGFEKWNKGKKKCLFKIGNEQNLGEAGGDEKEIVSLLNHALVINLFK